MCPWAAPNLPLAHFPVELCHGVHHFPSKSSSVVPALGPGQLHGNTAHPLQTTTPPPRLPPPGALISAHLLTPASMKCPQASPNHGFCPKYSLARLLEKGKGAFGGERYYFPASVPH